MTTARRRFLACVLALACAPVRSQELANRPIRVVVPFIAGSSLDSRMRVIAAALSERLKQQVIVDNKPGAGGSIGAALVAQAPADGLTLLFTNNSYAINPHVYQNAGYDPLKSFAPITQGYVSALVVVINADSKAQTLKELVALVKATPDAFSYGSSGPGSLPHFAAELFFHLAGIKPLHVPFKGDAQSLTEVLAGRVSMNFSGILAAQPHIQSGKLRALAVTSQQRVPALKGVPTIPEAGWPAYNDPIWAGFFAPAATPKPIVEKLNRAIVAALGSANVKAHMEATGAQSAGNTPAEFSLFVQKEVARYASLVKTIGLTVE
jgi:tripartite-type tricarboxylate transporter receptor subunit TctC